MSTIMLAAKTRPLSPAPSPSVLEELFERAQRDIEAGKLAPGRKLDAMGLARWLRCVPGLAEEIFPPLLNAGLLIADGSNFIVAAVDISDLVPKLDARATLERQIARDAALAVVRSGLTPAQRQKFHDQLSFMERCARVGDIEGYIRENNILELHLAALSERAEDFATLILMKRAFRRAWIARNWLGDLIEPVELRTRLVHAILAGDHHQAELAVDAFITYLRRSFREE
jgi:DNA-binding GntR family transcriptional regulator